MINLRISLLCLALVAGASAQEASPLPSLPSLPDFSAEESQSEEQDRVYQEQIRAAELHLQAGVQKLHDLHRVLLEVKDAESAAAAIPAIVRITGDLHDWAARFSDFPEPTPEDLERIQSELAPAIRRINSRIANQADRLGSAEYYGCTDLAAVLAQFVLRLRR